MLVSEQVREFELKVQREISEKRQELLAKVSPGLCIQSNSTVAEDVLLYRRRTCETSKPVCRTPLWTRGLNQVTLSSLGTQKPRSSHQLLHRGKESRCLQSSMPSVCRCGCRSGGRMVSCFLLSCAWDTPSLLYLCNQSTTALSSTSSPQLPLFLFLDST